MKEWAVEGTLWVNPFLNNFYQWGKGTWWDDKYQFIGCLDKSNFGEESYSKEEKEDYDYKKFLPREVALYIIKNVPEWYYQGCVRGGVPKMRTTINAFKMTDTGGDGGARGIQRFLDAWENNEPFMTGVEFLPLEKIIAGIVNKFGTLERAEGYKYYPQYLKWKGNVLKSHIHYGSYVRLLDVKTAMGEVHYNSIYFTTERNKSWCYSNKKSFINWMTTNPIEVKE